jgi:hypothetical protein
MTFLSWLFITAHHYPELFLYSATIFLSACGLVLWAIDRAGGMV